MKVLKDLENFLSANGKFSIAGQFEKFKLLPASGIPLDIYEGDEAIESVTEDNFEIKVTWFDLDTSQYESKKLNKFEFVRKQLIYFESRIIDEILELIESKVDSDLEGVILPRLFKDFIKLKSFAIRNYPLLKREFDLGFESMKETANEVLTMEINFQNKRPLNPKPINWTGNINQLSELASFLLGFHEANHSGKLVNNSQSDLLEFFAANFQCKRKPIKVESLRRLLREDKMPKVGGKKRLFE